MCISWQHLCTGEIAKENDICYGEKRKTCNLMSSSNNNRTLNEANSAHQIVIEAERFWPLWVKRDIFMRAVVNVENSEQSCPVFFCIFSFDKAAVRVSTQSLINRIKIILLLLYFMQILSWRTRGPDQKLQEKTLLCLNGSRSVKNMQFSFSKESDDVAYPS